MMDLPEVKKGFTSTQCEKAMDIKFYLFSTARKYLGIVLHCQLEVLFHYLFIVLELCCHRWENCQMGRWDTEVEAASGEKGEPCGS